MKIIRPDFTNSIMNVSNSFLHYHKIETPYVGLKELDLELQKGYNHIIYVLLDGLGTNIIKKHLDQSQGLKKHLNKEITSVFPPTTVAATNAVLSAVPPITSGYIGWVQYFKQEDTDLTVFLNKDFYTDKPFDEVLRNKYLSYPNILEQIQTKNPHVKTTSLFPDFIENGVIKDFKDGIEKALMITHNTDQSFTYLYWVQPDLIEHKAGIYSEEVKQMVESLNKDYEELIDNINQDTLVVVIADHGLTDIEEINLFEYETLMNMLERKPSIEPRAINFFVKEGLLDSFKTEFNKHFEDKYMLLTKEEIFESNLFGEGKKHPLVDMFVGDYMALATDKYMFSVNSEKSYKAHHAGLSEDEVMVPFIMYSKK
jgi:predicted AlkP superfamily pyrophosphatase or phosphodiesterase